jgi:hypothetical protein
MADEAAEKEMDQELSDMFDEVIEAIDETEPEVEAEPEVAKEPVDEPEPDSEPKPEPEVEAVEEVEETQYVEDPIDEQPVDDVSAGVDVVDDESVGDMAALKAQNEALLKHIEELSGQVIGGVMQPQAAQAAEPKEVPQAQVPAPQASTEMMNFLGETSIDDLLEDPAKFNAVLNNVAQNAQAGAQQQAVQQVLRSVPELVMGYITRHSAMNRMVDDFYLENTDLVNVKQTVAAVANDVHAKNPELGVEEVFKQSADATRKLLGLQKQAVSRTNPKPKKPAFAKAGGARKVAPKVSAVQRELDDLLNGDF